ncbi:RHS repeat-associated core domain-containing protein [Permianibacter aggregans]|uniref:RHS repeat-associated protein n=1 Tax=Permianibacter aggregans TaxID=1510150 RepID=A0A4R6URL8_9GAMM|nr:RHS repeat-associated core domain-containing protein [Permianibacter aggregans]QGX39346.1 RHS repeat protein [Permianibacter aggregans]TDQ49920.1 RHS repeat-associated protein [Permianibacter aggregans]
MQVIGRLFFIFVLLFTSVNSVADGLRVNCRVDLGFQLYSGSRHKNIECVEPVVGQTYFQNALGDNYKKWESEADIIAWRKTKLPTTRCSDEVEGPYWKTASESSLVGEQVASSSGYHSFWLNNAGEVIPPPSTDASHDVASIAFRYVQETRQTKQYLIRYTYPNDPKGFSSSCKTLCSCTEEAWYYMYREQPVTCPAGTGRPYGGGQCYKEICPCGKVNDASGKCVSETKGEFTQWTQGGNSLRFSAYASGLSDSPYNKCFTEYEEKPKQCDGIGNPVGCASGQKRHFEALYTSSEGLHFRRAYNAAVGSLTGVNWDTDVKVFISLLLDGTSTQIVAVANGDGTRKLFVGKKGERLTGYHQKDGYVENVAGSWRFIARNGDVMEFGANGLLARKAARNGESVQFAYDASNRLKQLTAASGRQLTVGYNGAGQMDSLTEPNGKQTKFLYNAAGMLSEVIYPDETPSNEFDNPRKQFLYEDSRFPSALTGIVDENGSRFASYVYDGERRVIAENHAEIADKVEFEYLNDSTTMVKSYRTANEYHETLYSFYRSHGSDQFRAIEQMPCPGCATGTETREFNDQGLLSQITDKNGGLTTVEYHPSGLEHIRTEGLGTPEQKVTITEWNDEHRLPSRLVANGLEVVNRYTTQGLLQQRDEIESPTGKTLSSIYEYNTAGKLTSIDGPRTDASDITTYDYDSQGNLINVANALGHITTLSNYDPNGRVRQITDPNGLVTTLTYTARGWLKTRTVGSLTTTFDYDKVGQLIKVTMPDGSFVRYEYDAAHRLVAIENPLGERIEYTLDYAGNRTKEEIKDASGNVVLRRASEFNALNQLLRSLNAANQVTASYSYDANGNMTGVTRYTDSETASSSYQYDPLNRLKSITDALNGITQFSYDNLDQLNRVTDPKGLQTQYGVSALGELKQTDSPDTATSTQTFDSAGNVKTSTNARGHTTTYTYDALNRVTKLTYHDGSVVTFAYDSIVAGNYGKGRLTSVTDSSGSTQYRYDQYGRLTEKLATVNGVSFSTSYRYDQYGRLESITYPSGRDLSFSYQNGQLQQLNVDGSARVKNIAYQPFSAVKSWQWGDNSDYQRTFNLDGQLQSFPLGADVVTLSYDRAGRISAQTHAHTASRNQSYYYDLLDRVTGSSGVFEMSFSFDANGNRLSKTEGSAFDQYTVSETSNRIDTISGALNRSYQYDAAGNTLSDGDRSYTYNTANRLTTITKGSVTQDNLYNGLGQRVRKTVDGVSTLFIYDEAGHLIGEYDAAGTPLMEVVYLGDQPILAMKPSGVYYVHADHLNTPRAIIGANQTVIWRWDSAAFGETAANEDPDGNGLAFRFNHRFPGQVLDVEVGLHYNYFRNYDPVTGRYIESDPIGLSDGVNTYGYVQQMPTQLKDPLGLFCVPMWDSESDWMDIGVRIYTGKYKVQPNTAGMMGWCNWKREYKVKQSRTVTARELCFECSDTCEGSDCGYAVKERKKSKEYRDHIDWERGDTTQQHVFGRFASGEGCCKNPWTGVMSCGPI